MIARLATLAHCPRCRLLVLMKIIRAVLVIIVKADLEKLTRKFVLPGTIVLKKVQSLPNAQQELTIHRRTKSTKKLAYLVLTDFTAGLMG